ncbi:MAG: VWA domain-containing protein [Agarilytica sp.]
MLINFFSELKSAKVPVSLTELLTLIEAIQARLAFGSIDEFYLLARAIMVKDEKYYDRFDLAFATYFNGVQNLENILDKLIPEDWVKSEFLRSLTDEEKARIQSLGGLDELIKTFKERLEEQSKRHQGGSKWIGTGGTSPFGNSGFNPEGIRVGGDSKNKSAAKVWEKREFKNLDDGVALGTRNIKVALKKLRKFARTGAAEELDLDDTISSTARNAGYLDLKMVPERHNAVKVLLFFDVGGSMDPYVSICEELFSACRSEFKHMEYFYFHNFIYENVWKDNHRRRSEPTPLMDILHTYSRDYRVIFIGDASMSPYEIVSQYGCVEEMNDVAGALWMERVTHHFNKVIWLNPVAERFWGYTHSIGITSKLLDNKMFPLTIDGLTKSIAYLSR